MCDKTGHYLKVNNEDFISPVPRKRHVTRKNRTLSPAVRAPSPANSFDESLLRMASASSTEDLRPSSAISLQSLTHTDSSDSLRKHHHKSIDNLCFARKKLHRRAFVHEIYRPRSFTDPGEEKPQRPLTIPILRIPEDETTTTTSSQECNDSDTTPSTPTDHIPTPSLAGERKRSIGSGVLGSLLKQTIKVTTASMGLRAASMERLAPFRPLNEDDKHRISSSLAQLPTDSLSPMAPLQTHTECISVQCLNTLDKDYNNGSSSSTNNDNTATTSLTTSSSPPQKTKRAFQHQLSIPESLQSTSIGCATSSEYSSARSLKHSATSLTPLPTLNSSGSLRSISPSRRSASSNSSSTAKHEQSTAAATAAAAATATTSNGSSSATTPPEKEKKRKEISSSRVKKFHRHFAQVSKDEKLINYYSCALVSDILLQGHLYITDQHFAFYSNVFGYVTKVVIPTSSVTKISKEKTAKIIPNAVGVATADERHVFGSFISREAAFRLMCSVCPPLGVPEILPKDPANIEISEEYSIEDDSSCSISGNESPAQITELQNSQTNGNLLHNDTSQTILRRSVGSSNLSIADTRHSDIPINAKSATNTASSTRSSAPAAAHYANGAGGNVNLIGLKSVLQQQQQPALKPTLEGEVSKVTIIAGCASSTTSATSTPTPSTSSSPTTVMTLPSSKANRVINIFTSVSKNLMVHLKFPTEIHVVYLGVMLTLLLALFSIFLLYRILDIEAKTNGYRSPVEFNWRSGNDDDIFSEALRFQKQLQLKSTEEAQNILKTNLEQIAKVRRSLETLSMLIHDRSSSFVSTHTDDSD
ncbi:uncharacterized protein LOC135957502 isoform X2 [Calliphora vicina]|uniref:uncharacterized protein LOC135957502 isoform X2 n=1 Tax=Calliphora vicina TaxID=7373 RepID=UPI00325B272C